MNLLLGFIFLLVNLKLVELNLLVYNLSVENNGQWLRWNFKTETKATQNAYQILVATSKSLLYTENPDLWNSGEVLSTKTANIKYEGNLVPPQTTIYWAVRIWDQYGQVSNYSYSFWKRKWSAQWIKAPKSVQEDILKKLEPQDLDTIKKRPGLKPVLFFRKTFSITKKVKEATAYVSSKGLNIA